MGSSRSLMSFSFRFQTSMLNGHPGNIARDCRRVIVRASNHGLLVTATTDGRHALRSWHKILPPRNFRGRAVDFGVSRELIGSAEARARMVDFQRDLIQHHGPDKFHEIFGPDNLWNVRNGVRVALGEGTDLESAHDNHVHVAPRLTLPALHKTAAQVRAARRARRRRQNKELARARGVHYVDAIFDAADKHNVGLALALGLFQQESNYLNQYGHDRDRHGTIIWHGKTGRVTVTKENYAAYKAWRKAHGLAQGVGPGQLTSPGYQDLADQRGGCWNPAVNIDVSLEILAGHINALGTRRGIGAYNGGRGNPNLTYADTVLGLRDKWAAILK